MVVLPDGQAASEGALPSTLALTELTGVLPLQHILYRPPTVQLQYPALKYGEGPGSSYLSAVEHELVV